MPKQSRSARKNLKAGVASSAGLIPEIVLSWEDMEAVQKLMPEIAALTGIQVDYLIHRLMEMQRERGWIPRWADIQSKLARIMELDVVLKAMREDHLAKPCGKKNTKR